MSTPGAIAAAALAAPPPAAPGDGRERAGRRRRAQSRAGAIGPDYKALVCLFHAGGNDGENTLIRHDTAGLSEIRGGADARVGASTSRRRSCRRSSRHLATPFGFHPACAPLKTLFDPKRLAVLANVGVLAQPSARAGLENGSTRRPANLFSHPDQELAVQSADASGFTRTGWGGRLADRLEASRRNRCSRR